MKYSEQDNNPRTSFEVGELGVKGRQLVPNGRILFAPLHIKLGLFSQFIVSLPADCNAKKYLKEKFPYISQPKIDNGAGFDGSKIRRLFKDAEFKKKLTKVQRDAWVGLISLSENFLGNHRSADYEQVVSDFIRVFEKQGIKETVKLHFLRSHLYYFRDNCGMFSDEQGERFHQEVTAIEKRYRGHCDKAMLADYVWGLKHETNYKFGYIRNF